MLPFHEGLGHNINRIIFVSVFDIHCLKVFENTLLLKQCGCSVRDLIGYRVIVTTSPMSV